MSKLGQSGKNFYMDESIRIISDHRAVLEHLAELRKQCCGAGVVQYPECEEDVVRN